MCAFCVFFGVGKWGRKIGETVQGDCSTMVLRHVTTYTLGYGGEIGITRELTLLYEIPQRVRGD